MPTRGFTILTTASASTTWSFRESFNFSRLFISKGLLVHIKHPPSDKSDVTPLPALPIPKSINSASAAKGCRIAYRRSRTNTDRDPSLFK